MKNILVLAVVLLFSVSILAQTKKPITAEGLYQQALQLYAEDDFKECIKKIDRIEILSPKASAKVLYLKTKTLYQLCQIENNYCQSFAQAFNVFLTIAPAQNYPVAKIDEIKGLEPQLQIINAARIRDEQRLAAIRDSVKATQEKETKTIAIYNKALQLYEVNNWMETFLILNAYDSLFTKPDIRIVYLKIKALYPLFTKDTKYKLSIQEAFTQFIDISNSQDFPTDKKQEVMSLEQSYTDKIRKIEADKARKTEIIGRYQRAEQLYEEDKLEECVTQLQELESFMGAPNPKTLYLKIKALRPIYQKEEKYKKALEQALPQFFQLAETQNSPIQKVKEIKLVNEGFRGVK
jgi:hypothetical protein